MIALRLPRFARRIGCWATGTPWLQCPGCRAYFGGWETAREQDHHVPSISVTDIYGVAEQRVICPDCTSAGLGCRINAMEGRIHHGCIYLKIDNGYEI